MATKGKDAGGKAKRKGKAASKVSSEDQQLWDYMAEGLSPLKRVSQRVHAELSAREQLNEALGDPFGPLPQVTKPNEADTTPALKKSGPGTPQPPAPKKKIVPELTNFEKRAARRLQRGQFEIEARIDLHGKRQNEAHAELRSFLMSSYARGLRWVLVITGKGSRTRQQDDEAPFGVEVERGVLRRNVPKWLAQPELRSVVVSYTTAAQHHGGDGALYVQLRNPNRTKKKR